MTKDGFLKAITFIEGAVSRDFTTKTKDALWSILDCYEDREVMTAARRFVVGEDAKRGLPTAAHLVALINAERRYVSTQAEPTNEPASDEEARKFLGEMRARLRGSLRLVHGGRGGAA